VQYIEKNFKITTQCIKNNVKKFDQLANKFDAMVYSDYKGTVFISVGNKIRKFIDETNQLKF